MKTITKIIIAAAMVVGIIVIIPIADQIVRSLIRNMCIVQLPEHYRPIQMEQCIDKSLGSILSGGKVIK
jgi:hypothetical protein